MEYFSYDSDSEQNIGELILETLLSSNINSINDLNLSYNSSWFNNPNTGEERSGNVDLLVELILKQASLQKIDLRYNFSDNAKQTIKTRITDHSKIQFWT